MADLILAIQHAYTLAHIADDMRITPPRLDGIVGQQRQQVFLLVGFEFVECTHIELIVGNNLRHKLLAVIPCTVARILSGIEADIVLRKTIRRRYTDLQQ